MAQAVIRRFLVARAPSSIPVKSVYGFWWTNWHCLVSSQSVLPRVSPARSFIQCSGTRLISTAVVRRTSGVKPGKLQTKQFCFGYREVLERKVGLLSYFCKSEDRAVGQAASHRPFTPNPRIPSRAGPCEQCVGLTACGSVSAEYFGCPLSQSCLGGPDSMPGWPT